VRHIGDVYKLYVFATRYFLGSFTKKRGQRCPGKYITISITYRVFEKLTQKALGCFAMNLFQFN